jgi:dimethylargininase
MNFTAFVLQPRRDTCHISLIGQRYKYTFAIARELPDSFPNAVSMDDSNLDDDRAKIDMRLAREQHEVYIQALRQCVPVLLLPVATRSSPSLSVSSNTDDMHVERNDKETTSMDLSKICHDDDEDNKNINPDEVVPTNEYPDCAFVEDTVIAIKHQALITRMGHESRRGEGDAISSILQQLGMEVLDMNEYYNTTDWIYGRGYSHRTGSTVTSPPVIDGELATVDGGDVLFTERHIYVGLSDRTNMEGARFIREYFSSYEVIVVPQMPLDPNINLPHPMPLHLKSAVTHIDSYTLLLPTGPYGDYLEEAMNIEEFAYKVHRVPNLLSCNVVSCNGQVIVQDAFCKQSQEILFEAVMDSDQDLIRVDTSELAKKDAALTCGSVLLQV